jgi:hypothetical protein
MGETITEVCHCGKNLRHPKALSAANPGRYREAVGLHHTITFAIMMAWFERRFS